MTKPAGGSPPLKPSSKLFLVFLEQQRCVRSAKPKTIGKRVPYFSFPGLVRDVIQITFGIGRFVIDRRQQKVAVNRKNGKNSFDATRCAQQVSGHGLGRANRY